MEKMALPKKARAVPTMSQALRLSTMVSRMLQPAVSRARMMYMGLRPYFSIMWPQTMPATAPMAIIRPPISTELDIWKPLPVRMVGA